MKAADFIWWLVLGVGATAGVVSLAGLPTPDLGHNNTPAKTADSSASPEWTDTSAAEKFPLFKGDPGYPSLLWVRGDAWSVTTVLSPNNDFRAGGWTDCTFHQIYLVVFPFQVEGWRTAKWPRQVLIHELIHAGACGTSADDWHNVVYFNSTDDSDHGHDGLNRLAFYFEEVLRANPELAMYLANVRNTPQYVALRKQISGEVYVWQTIPGLTDRRDK